MGTRHVPFPFARLTAALALVGVLFWLESARAAQPPADPKAAKSEYTVSETFEKKFALEKPRLALDPALDQILPPAGVSSSDSSGETAPEFVRYLIDALGVPAAEATSKPWLPDVPGPDVARFQFKVPTDIHYSGWKLQITDTEGNLVGQVQKTGRPPEEVSWNGKNEADQPAKVGATYTYRLQLTDHFGKTNTYLGKSFQLMEMQYEQDNNLVVQIAVDRLFAPGTSILSAEGSDMLERVLQDIIELPRPNYAFAYRDSASPALRKERSIALKKFIVPRIRVAMEDLDLDAPLPQDRVNLLQIVVRRS